MRPILYAVAVTILLMMAAAIYTTIHMSKPNAATGLAAIALV